MSNLKSQDSKHWTIDVQEDPESGELFLQIPDEALQIAGWDVGDVIEWNDNQDGTWSLIKKK